MPNCRKARRRPIVKQSYVNTFTCPTVAIFPASRPEQKLQSGLLSLLSFILGLLIGRLVLLNRRFSFSFSIKIILLLGRP